MANEEDVPAEYEFIAEFLIITRWDHDRASFRETILSPFEVDDLYIKLREHFGDV